MEQWVSTKTLFGDDHGAILTIISEDCFEEIEELNAQVFDIFKEVEVPKATARFPCGNCHKICKTERGLRRHSNVKHGLQLSTVFDFEPKLTAEEFKKYALECSTKLSCDECYSEETMTAFKNFELSEEEAMISFQHVKNVIQKFDGDGEKFFPSFYNCVSGGKHVFPRLSRKCSVLLGYEVANSILAHLNGQHKQDNTNNNTSTVVELNCKEKNIVTYLSGYVFGTLYSVQCTLFEFTSCW